MLEFRHILVPIDLHEHTGALADMALATANRLGAARTTFLHVMPHLPDYSDYKFDILKQLQSSFRSHAEAKMNAFLATVKDRAKNVEGVVIDGDTADAILAYASERDVDFIIIATHGSQGVEKILLGSVADRVIKGASCPTLVFNPFAKERGYEVCRPLSSCVQSV